MRREVALLNLIIFSNKIKSVLWGQTHKQIRGKNGI